ncbi:MAG: hypothetical protein COU33_04850, partial [Candidatus Magasanikbacteria bacterium CG10_big_fil_rev_8_21_14_0_10_43_6]
DIHTPTTKPIVTILGVGSVTYRPSDKITVSLSTNSVYPIVRADYFFNGVFIGSSTNAPFSFSFAPQNTTSLESEYNTIKVNVYDSVQNQSSSEALVTIINGGQ